LRQRISAVMEWAIAMNLRSDNPCDQLRPVLGKQNEVMRNVRALPQSRRGGGGRDRWEVDRGQGRKAGVRVPRAHGGALERGTRGTMGTMLDTEAQVWDGVPVLEDPKGS